MAQYKILKINKMTSGSRRGLIDMDIQLDYRSAKDIILLEGLSAKMSDMPGPVLSAGIITESGKFRYVRDQYIADFYEGLSNALATDLCSQSIVLNET